MSRNNPAQNPSDTSAGSNGQAHTVLALILAVIVIAGLAYGVIETVSQATALF